MKSLSKDVGHQTLETISKAGEFNKWLYETIEPFCYGRILEIGSGIGNLSSFFINNGKNITLSDYDELYVQLLKEKFVRNPSIEVFQLDLNDENFKKKHKGLQNSFDSIFLLNVLEHINDDLTAVDNCRFLLKTNGNLLILVPSSSFLYSKMDINLGHYRRYSSSSLKAVLLWNKLEVTRTFHFNALGIAGWWWNKLLKKEKISEQKMKAFNKMVPLAKFLDGLFFNRIGLSVVSIAIKKS
jgi:SAM-dependent methyltransferase